VERKKKAEKLNYMHANPVTRGLVRSAKQWLWSSYGFYFGRRDVLLPIDPV
jgi:putative transposase